MSKRFALNRRGTIREALLLFKSNFLENGKRVESMKIISAIFGTVLLAAAYNALVLWYDRKLNMKLKKKGFLVCSKFSIFILTLSIVSWVYSALTADWGFVTTVMILFLVCGMSVVAVTDHYKKKIPNSVLKWGLLFWVAMSGIYIISDIETGTAFLFQSLAGGIAAGIIFLLCYFVSRKQLGMGDVKLAFVMGLYLTGQRILGAIFYGAILSCCFCVVQMIRKKLTMHDAVPFAPFLYLGTLVTLFLMG